jgi:catechol 2,3-dioxygenase-like lactoylglutathione lyase family enzyme
MVEQDIIKRTTLIVRDAERAAAWYEQVFGMTRVMDTPFTLSGMQLAAGKKGDQTRLVILKCVDDSVGMIGLLQWIDPPMPAPDELPTRIGFGAPIFVVSAQDCRATLARARAAGSRIHCEPRDWTVRGFDGREQAMVGASFFDLDGYFFEVNERVA